MRGQSALVRTARSAGLRATAPRYVCWQCRAIQVSASPATESPKVGGDAFGAPAGASRDTADARFEVLGSPYSMLSVTLSASQRLYTRRGTLVSVAGKAENATSSLSLLSPLARAPFGIPFLYQRITSTTPITALIATRSPSTTFTILHLDGTTDWMVAQRNALLAWTGHTLSATPRLQTSLALAHWGATQLTGRGLAALAAPGQTYQVTLAPGEELAVHPSHVVAYTLGRAHPQPFRFRSSALGLSVPAVPGYITELPARITPERVTRFLRAMRDTDTYRFLGRVLFGLRTAARRSIWGDRLFLRFRGPATLLVSSRGVRVADVLTRDDVNEIADAEAGAVERAGRPAKPDPAVAKARPGAAEQPVAIHIAEVGKDGRVRFEDTKDLKEFVR